MKPSFRSSNKQSSANKPSASASVLIHLFNATVGLAHNTRLIGEADEPEYLPMDENSPYHRIYFRCDYCASALHEIAHWCIAGEARRQLPDYGYWYLPDGRSLEQQHEFELVEARPQALEWLFSEACELPFRVSADNLGASLGPSTEFKQSVVDAVYGFCQDGVNSCSADWLGVLSTYFKTGQVLDKSRYSIDALN